MAKSYRRTVQLQADDLRWLFRHHAGWPRHVTLTEYDNPVIVRSRYPMQYQPLPCPALARLRDAFALDDVVRDAPGDVAFFLGLSQWVRSQWGFGNPDGPEPPWDAAELIRRGRAGSPLHSL